jgi:hypothetical protein
MVGDDRRRLAGAAERARDNGGGPEARRQPFRRGAYLRVAALGQRDFGRQREDAIAVPLALPVPDEDEAPHQPSRLTRSIS